MEAGDVSRGRLSDLVKAEASLGAHRAVCSHSHLGRGAGGGNYKVITHKMQLIFLPGLLEVDLYLIPVVDLFLYVLIYLGCDPRLVGYLVVQGLDPLSGSVVIFSQFNEVLLVEVFDGDLVIDGVHGGVLHDGLDPLLLSE